MLASDTVVGGLCSHACGRRGKGDTGQRERGTDSSKHTHECAC